MNNYLYNLDRFESKQCKILFVTGVCGSGKTTLAQQLAEKYNAEFIELDEIRRSIRNTIPVEISLTEKADLIINEALSRNKSKRVVIEGVEVFLFSNTQIIKDNSVIIIRDSPIIASLRALYRDFIQYPAYLRHPEFTSFNQKLNYMWEHVLLNYSISNISRWKELARFQRNFEI